jgi:hypothetical protein
MVRSAAVTGRRRVVALTACSGSLAAMLPPAHTNTPHCRARGREAVQLSGSRRLGFRPTAEDAFASLSPGSRHGQLVERDGDAGFVTVRLDSAGVGPVPCLGDDRN